MTADAIKAEAVELAGEYACELRNALRKAHTPTDYEKLIAGFHRRIDQIFAEKLAEAGDTIACRAGCKFCCHIKVDALAIEVFYLVSHLTSRLSGEQVDEIRAKAKANRKRIAGMTREEQQSSAIECPLLNRDGNCMCYKARPAVCRKYHSHSAVPCLAMFEGKATKDMRGEVTEIMYPLTALLGAARRAFTDEGYDAMPYDFSSALDEGLSNPSCYKRWRAGKRAFSKDLAAKDWSGG